MFSNQKTQLARYVRNGLENSSLNNNVIMEFIFMILN